MNEGGSTIRPGPLEGAPELAFAADGTVVETQTRGGSEPGRGAALPFGPVQGVLVVAGWVVFLWAWISVMSHTAPVTMLWTLVFLGACAVANEVVALAWIFHNLRIFARKGPRRAVFVPEHAFTRDFLDRELDADWPELRAHGAILVTFDDASKTYIPYRGDPTAEKLVGRADLEVPAEDGTG